MSTSMTCSADTTMNPFDPELIRRHQALFSRKAEDPGLFPERLTLELSFACNLRCPVCPRHHVRHAPRPRMIDGALARDLIRSAAEHGTKTLVPFFRGESLMHPELIPILAFAKKVGIDTIQLATNATLLDEEKARALLDLEISSISFSVDTTDEATYRMIRKNAEYGATIRNIERFLELRAGRAVRVEAQVSAVDSELSEHEKERFIAFWTDKVERVRIYPEHSTGGRFGKLAHGANATDPPPTRYPCLKPVTDMVVYCDGSIGLCNHDWERPDDAPLGHTATTSLADIYRGGAYRRMRRWHTSPTQPGPIPCESCDHWMGYYLADGLVGELHRKA